MKLRRLPLVRWRVGAFRFVASTLVVPWGAFGTETHTIRRPSLDTLSKLVTVPSGVSSLQGSRPNTGMVPGSPPATGSATQRSMMTASSFFTASKDSGDKDRGVSPVRRVPRLTLQSSGWWLSKAWIACVSLCFHTIG
jgi:hypothetical protein